MKIKKKIKLLDFKLTKRLGTSLFGLYKSMFYGNGIDFVKHKEYVPGDYIKSIDWKASSRTDKIYSKVFEDERNLKLLFLIKVGDSMNFGAFGRTKQEILEEIFYSISMSASISGDSIGALLYGKTSQFIDYKKGSRNVFKVLEALEVLEVSLSPTLSPDGGAIVSNALIHRIGISALQKPSPNLTDLTPSQGGREEEKSSPLIKGVRGILTSIKDVFEYLQKQNLKNNMIFVLTDETDLVNDRNLQLLSFSNQIIFFNIFDYFENNLCDLDVNLSLTNGSDFLNLSLNDKQKVEAFREKRMEDLNKLENFLKKNKISYRRFDTKEDTFKKLYLFFK